MPAFFRRDLVLAALMGGTALPAVAAGPVAWDFTFPAIDGGELPLAQFTGKAVMVVNTASFCGYTYQYAAIERLYKENKNAGLMVVGVPSRDFNQEQDSNAKVKTFCETEFGIDFPLAGISKVVGEGAAPFYRWVKTTKRWQPSWNFNKVLIGRDGAVFACFGSGDEPNGMRIRKAVALALAAAP